MNSKELRSKALAKITEARSVEDNAAAIALMDEAKALNERAAKLEEVEAIEAELSTPVEARNLPDTKAEVRKETKEDTEERNFVAVLRGEKRAQSVAASDEGGLTVPTTIARDLITAAVDYSPMLDESIFDVERTTSGNPMAYAVRAGQRRARLIAEGAAATELTGKLGSVVLGAHKLTTDAAVASRELLQDSAIDVRKWLIDEQAESVGLGAGYQLTVGVGGASAPTGICTALASKATEAAYPTASATNAELAALADALLDLQYGVNATYRKRGSYMINSDVERLIRKAKDADGNPIWQASTRDGAPATIHGLPYIINDEMTSADGDVFAVFGDMKQYKVRISRDLSITQLNETYALSDQIGWVGFMRLDGNVMQKAAFAALKVKTGTGVEDED
nr:phage major capsid protein [Brevundimonas naejangsanensis]